jgi:hypothetical protein
MHIRFFKKSGDLQELPTEEEARKNQIFNVAEHMAVANGGRRR